MKICIVSQYWEPDVNGDVSRLKKVIRELIQLGHEITLIAGAPHYPAGDKKGFHFKFLKLSREKGLTVLRIRMPSLPHSNFTTRFTLYFWFAGASVLPTIVLGKSKFVWAFDQRVFSTYTALFAKLFWHEKLVSDVTDVWPEALINTGYAKSNSLFYKGAKFASRVAYRISDEITTITPHMVDMFYDGYGVQKEKVRLIPNIGKEVPKSQGNESAVKKDKFVILYYGNLGTNYDFSPVLQIAEKMKNEPVEFVIKASGGEWLQKIQQRKKEVNLDNLLVLTKVMSEEELHNLVNSADALILSMGDHPFPDASFPIKFVEYLYASKPIIFIGRGYPRELIEKYQIGLAADWGDIDGVIKFIGSLRGNSDLCVEMGSKAKALADRMFSEAIFKNSLKGLLQDPIYANS